MVPLLLCNNGKPVKKISSNVFGSAGFLFFELSLKILRGDFKGGFQGGICFETLASARLCDEPTISQWRWYGFGTGCYRR